MVHVCMTLSEAAWEKGGEQGVSWLCGFIFDVCEPTNIIPLEMTWEDVSQAHWWGAYNPLGCFDDLSQFLLLYVHAAGVPDITVILRCVLWCSGKSFSAELEGVCCDLGISGRISATALSWWCGPCSSSTLCPLICELPGTWSQHFHHKLYCRKSSPALCPGVFWTVYVRFLFVRSSQSVQYIHVSRMQTIET